MQKKLFFQLIDKYTSGRANSAEKELVEEYYQQLSLLGDTQLTTAEEEELQLIIWQKIQHNTHNKSVVRHITRYAAAAVIIVALCVGTYTWFKAAQQAKNTAHQKNTIASILPGSNKAILIIGNNRPIDLAANKNGIAVRNAITYNDGEKIADAGEMLQLTTPRGGQYQAVLPDGTKIWLNAASSIKFPSRFDGNERRIEITGEAYIEVNPEARSAKRLSPFLKGDSREAAGGYAPHRPFIITANGTEIQVLGTSFNINAYEDEAAIKTTLLTGSVKVRRTIALDEGIILRPGEQTIIKNDASPIKKISIEPIATIAWKNGLFNLEDADIPTIMRELSRWYDVEIVYSGKPPVRQFGGKISRNLNLDEVIKILAFNGVQCQLEGRKLVLLP